MGAWLATQGDQAEAPHDGDASAGASAPSSFLLCPLSRSVMREPVLLIEDGQTYSSEAITTHIGGRQGQDGGAARTFITTVPNLALRRLSEEVCHGDAGVGLTAGMEAWTPPSAFVCPITLEVMREPTLTIADGHTYERTAIEAWFAQSRRAPATGAKLPLTLLMPNDALRTAIKEWRARLGVGDGGDSHGEEGEGHVPWEAVVAEMQDTLKGGREAVAGMGVEAWCRMMLIALTHYWRQVDVVVLALDTISAVTHKPHHDGEDDDCEEASEVGDGVEALDAESSLTIHHESEMDGAEEGAAGNAAAVTAREAVDAHDADDDATEGVEEEEHEGDGVAEEDEDNGDESEGEGCIGCECTDALSSAGACGAIADVMSFYAGDGRVMRAALSALEGMVQGAVDEERVELLLACLPHVVRCMKEMTVGADVQRSAMVVLARIAIAHGLAQPTAHSSDHVEACDVMVVVMATLAAFPDDHAVQHAGLAAVVNWCNESPTTTCIDRGVCAFVLRAFHRFHDHMDVRLLCLMALANLTRSEDDVRAHEMLLADDTAVEMLVAGLASADQTKGDPHELALLSLTLLNRVCELTRGACERVRAAGVYAALVHVLQPTHERFAGPAILPALALATMLVEHFEQVTREGCDGDGRGSGGGGRSREGYVAELSVLCAPIVAIMRARNKCATVQAAGMDALEALTRISDDDNVDRDPISRILTANKAWEVVVAALKRFPKHHIVQIRALITAGNMAWSKKMRNRLSSSGIVGLICAAMEHFKEDDPVIVPALYACRRLAVEDSEAIRLMIGENLHVALVDALRRQSSSCGIKALGNLACTGAYARQIITAGMCEAMVAALKTLPANKHIIQACLYATQRLTSRAASLTCSRLCECEWPAALMSALSAYADEACLHRSALNLLLDLTAPSGILRQQLLAAGGMSWLADVLRRFTDNEDITSSVLGIIGNIALLWSPYICVRRDPVETLLAKITCETLGAIKKAVDAHTADEDVQHMGAWAIAKLAESSSVMASRLHSVDAHVAVVNAMKAYTSTRLVQLYGLQALFYLSLPSLAMAERVRECTVASEVTLAAMIAHKGDAEIRGWAFDVLAALSPYRPAPASNTTVSSFAFFRRV